MEFGKSDDAEVDYELERCICYHKQKDTLLFNHRRSKVILKGFRWIPWKINLVHIKAIGFNASGEWKTTDPEVPPILDAFLKELWTARMLRPKRNNLIS
jgi:hypothetical protein